MKRIGGDFTYRDRNVVRGNLATAQVGGYARAKIEASLSSVSSQCLLIVDPDLTGLSGHNFNYSTALARVAAARKLPCSILASAFTPVLVTNGSTLAQPEFPLRRQAPADRPFRRLLFLAVSFLPAPVANNATQRLRAGLCHLRTILKRPTGRGFGGELEAAIARFGSKIADQNIVLVHTIGAGRLASVADDLTPSALGQLLVVLRHSPAEMDKNEPAAELIATVLTRLVAAFGSRLRLFADTEGLAGLYQRLVSHPVGVVPLPVVALPPKAGPIGAPAHIVFAGVARSERGYTILPHLISALRGRARFTVQHGPIGPSDDPIIQKANRELRRYVGVSLTLIEESLEPDAFNSLLASADIILLPYNGPAYGQRSSGLLGEALALGIPLVVPSNTWMADVGAERVVVFENAAGILPAIETMLRNLPALTAAARAGAAAWRRRHSPERLLDTLVPPV